MRAEAADDPASAQLNKGIGTTHRPADDRLIQNLGRALVILGPVAGGRDQGFGFAGDSAAVPVGDGDIARVPQAAQAGDAAAPSRYVKSRAGIRCSMASIALIGTSSFHGWQRVHLRPEVDRIAQFALGNLAQPVVVLTQDERQVLHARKPSR